MSLGTKDGAVLEVNIAAPNLSQLAGSVLEVIHGFDTTPPVITLNGLESMTIMEGTTFTDPGATAIDDMDGTLTPTVTGVVDTSIPAIYTLTYNVTDAAGNAAIQKIRTVEVVTESNTDWPVIYLEGDNPLYISQGNSYVEPGYTALTNEEDGPEVFEGWGLYRISQENVTIVGTVNTGSLGTYNLVYSVADSGAKTTQITRTVIVEKEKPNLVSSDFTINTYKIANYESGPTDKRQLPFRGASKTASNIRKTENLYSRENKEIREIQAGINLKEKNLNLYKQKYKLTDITIDSKHTPAILQEALKKRNRKIIYHDIKNSLSYSDTIMNQISNKLEELLYLEDTVSTKNTIKNQLEALDVESDIGSQVQTIVDNVRNPVP